MAATSLASHVGVAPACQALGVSRATFYRRQRPAPGRQQPPKTPVRALAQCEREHVLDVLACPRFVDRSPAEVVAVLLDEGQYLCSERTMYRILAANHSTRERRHQLTHPPYTKPELLATAPNQTWSWDITRLLGPKHWTYFSLYVLLDIFSRYVVGWMLAERENAALASRLIEQSCLKQGIKPQVLTLHSERGAPMTSKCTAQLLADLGVTRSLSRPHVSDDNPFSEAQFKTLKSHPSFPGRFEDIAAATAPVVDSTPQRATDPLHGQAGGTPALPASAHPIHSSRAFTLNAPHVQPGSASQRPSAVSATCRRPRRTDSESQWCRSISRSHCARSCPSGTTRTDTASSTTLPVDDGLPIAPRRRHDIDRLAHLRSRVRCRLVTQAHESPG